MPAFIDPLADRTKLFGEVIALKEDFDGAFGRGDIQLHNSGAAEAFLDGTGGKSYLFVPIKDLPGKYAVYDPNGRRMGDQAWTLPPGELPDPQADAVD